MHEALTYFNTLQKPVNIKASASLIIHIWSKGEREGGREKGGGKRREKGMGREGEREEGREWREEGRERRGEGREWREEGRERRGERRGKGMEGGREGGEGGGLINKHYRIVENFTSINYQQTARK